jgi:hypothetical protein
MAITKEKIDTVKAEMIRLVKTLDALEKRISAKEKYFYLWAGSPETSAVKRASMDLTRALASLRRARQ